MSKLIRILANSKRISLRAIATKLADTHQKTLGVRLPVCLMNDLISEIPRLGTQLARITKTPKYLFGAPDLRRALVPISSSAAAALADRQAGQLRGSLLADTVAR